MGLDANSDGTGTECSLVDSAVNQAVQRVLEDTLCYVTPATIDDFDGTSSDYTLDATILEIAVMWFSSGGTNYRLERLSIEGLVEKRRVANPTGTPTAFYALAGASTLMFWPTPGAADTLNFYYIPIPTSLSATGDDPSSTSLGGVPKILHEAIFFYACKRLASYDDDQSSAQGQRYQDWYDAEIKRYREIIRRRAGFRLLIKTWYFDPRLAICLFSLDPSC